MADRPGRGSDVLADPMVLAIDGPGEDDDAGGDAAPSLLPGAPQPPGGAGAEGGAEGGAAAAAEGGRPRGMQRSLSMAKHHLQQASQVIETTLLEALDERGKLHPVPLDVAASKLEVGGLELSVEVEGAWERAQLAAHPTPKHRKSPEKGKAAKAKYETRRSSSAMDDGPCVRRAAAALIATQVLEFVVIISIVVNTVILAAQHPNNDYSASANTAMESIDLALTCVFTVEMAIRIAAHGFNTAAQPGQPAYFHEGWNRLDFFVVIISWVSVIYDLAQPSGADGNLSGLLQSLSALRLLRFLRVIKSVPFFADVGAILATLGDSVAQSANILGFLFFVFLVAGIVGIQMFSGMLAYRCSVTPPAPDLTGWDRPAGGDGGMGLGIQHRHCFPTPPADPDSRTPENLCSATDCPGVLVYPDHDADREPVLANNTSAGCPKCFQDHGSCQGEEMCWKFGNPGFGYHGFDNIVMAWGTIFIWMTQLYWWETAYIIENSDAGVSSTIAWYSGFLIVVMLAFLTVNMFVAVITNTFAAARAQAAVDDVHEKLVPVFVHVRHTDRTHKSLDSWVTTTIKGQRSVGELKEVLARKFNLPKKSTKVFLGQLKEDDVYNVGEVKLVPDVDRRWGFPTRQMADEEELSESLLQEKTRRETKHERMEDAKEANKMYSTDQRDLRGTPAEAEMISPHRTLELKWKPPFYRVRFLHKIATSSLFETLVMVAIMANTCSLMFEGAEPKPPDAPMDALKVAEFVFTGVFVVEMLCKIFGMGMLNYLYTPVNCLDCLIVLLGVVSMISEIMPGSSVARLVRVFRVARVTRVGRVTRLFQMIESMRELILNVGRSSTTILNVVLVIIFTLTVQAIIGVQCFGGTFPASYTASYIPRRNFETFGRGWLLAFQTMTGDDWSNQMYAYMNVANPLGTFLFFAFCFVMTNYILLNLFVAVILENFELAEDEKVQKQADAEKEVWRSMLEHFIMGGSADVTTLGGAEKPQLKRAHSVKRNASAAAAKSPFAQFKQSQGESHHDWTCVSPIRWCIKGCIKGSFSCYTEQIQDGVRNVADKIPRCQDDNALCCSISEGNDSSLCLFHGRVKEKRIMVTNEFGEEVEEIVMEYSHPVRNFFERLENNKWFERFILLTIVLSSVALAWAGPPGSKDGLELWDGALATDVLDASNLVFFVIFVVEMAIKVIANGFLFTPDAYLMGGWNRLDFIVILFGVVDYATDQTGSMGRILRMGRCLRPLRMINKNEGMKKIITAVLQSISTNIGVMVLATTMYIIFSILGVQLFGGRFKYCSCDWAVGPSVWLENATMVLVDGEEVTGMNDTMLCLTSSTVTTSNGTKYHESTLPNVHTVPALVESNATVEACAWMNKPYRFDTFGYASESLFTASTLAGWTDIMEASLDVTHFYQQPQAFANPVAVVYWVLFVFMMGVFFTNLFVGVLVDHMNRSDGTALMTQEQLEWSDLHATTRHIKPAFRVLVPSSSLLRRLALRFVSDPLWDRLSSAAIIGNVAVMMLEFEGNPDWYFEFLESVNTGFLIFFSVECVLKLLAVGPVLYWTDSWNKFDIIVVAGSWVAMVIEVEGVQATRAFRAFRIALILKGSFGNSLRSLFGTLIMSVQPCMNIITLLLLQFSLFSILGMQLFAPPTNNTAEDWSLNLTRLPEFGQVQQTSMSNFLSFGNAMRLLFECISGKDWKIVMYEIEEYSAAVRPAPASAPRRLKPDALHNSVRNPNPRGPVELRSQSCTPSPYSHLIPAPTNANGCWRQAFWFFFLHYFFAVFILQNLFIAIIVDASVQPIPLS